MESRLLYSAAKSLEKKIQWTSFEKDNEWIYFAALDETDLDIVNSRIREHFSNENEIYLVFQRTNSDLLSQKQTTALFKRILGVSNFYLWNKELDKVMEFDRVGVLRYGVVVGNK